MRYLITGGSGLLGADLVEELLQRKEEVHYTYLNNEMKINGAHPYKLDILETKKLAELIKQIKPNVVIHTATIPSVDVCEKDKELAYKINTLATKKIAEVTKAIGAKLVYISTTFVFPNSTTKFSEEDIPAPINYYGVTKLGGELATAINPNHLIIRTDQIYGWIKSGQKKTYVVTVLEKIENDEKVEIFMNWYNSPTYVKDLSATIIGLLAKEKKGIYHVVGSTYLNRLEWGRKIAEIFGIDPNLVVGIDSSKKDIPATRTNCKIANDKAQKESGVTLKTIEDGLLEMKKIRDAAQKN
ncbi:MAG: SDR family oxidoreductase [Candidatus Micrarchaeota archaeon]|nr:SDR family oxidoreductase [Candidatus Micrarchaeota archaeon]